MPMNMSYCRFQNTLEALRECQNALDDAVASPLDDLSLEEKKAAVRLIKLCGMIHDDYAEATP